MQARDAPDVAPLLQALDALLGVNAYWPMIISFKGKDTEKLASGRRVRRFVNFERIALRKIRQFRVCFRWTKAGAEDVEIVDYH